MAKDDELKTAKRAYKEAKAVGNLQEEARWANVIGNILKNQGQYVEALSWMRKDYDISIKHLPVKHQIPTCQSLGEVYLRLQEYNNALIYQKKHLELAKDANDLIEQQRASTQLGRTYHEIFLNTNGEHCSVRNAKKYFRSAMGLAEILKKHPPPNRQSFVKEYIDAHNNLGMLEIDLDNLEEAQKFLRKGLKICDEEEVDEDDDGRTRLHHNLGIVYMELRKWDDARKHIEKDIVICNRIGHCEGEAKGYINLGELHYRNQKYHEASLCYKKAHKLATSMMDEDALVSQIKQNIETVEQAKKVMHELQKEEQKLKMLARNTEMARGTAAERKCLLQQNACLDILIEKSRSILSWRQFRAYAKRKKTIAWELCDEEKLGDSFLVIGESYQSLRNFGKALKWHRKSWEIYKLIGNLEGQALAKINIGHALDADGDWAGALTAFEEGYRIAIEARRPSTQLSALENMHYSNMIRFDNVDTARELQELIDRLKQSKASEIQVQEIEADCCPESETENDDQPPNSRSDVSFSSKKSNSKASKLKSGSSADEMNEDIPLISLLSSHKRLSKLRTANAVASTISKKPESSPRSMSRSSDSQTFGRKRIRVILSDDENEDDGVYCSRGLDRQCAVEDVATSDEFQRRSKHHSANNFEVQQDVSPVGSRCALGACTLNVEESSSNYKSMPTKFTVKDGKNLSCSHAYEADGFKFGANYSKADAETSRNLSSKCNYSFLNFDACGDDCQHIIFKIEEDLLHMKLDLFPIDDKLDMEQMVVEVACLYFLQLSVEKRSRGLAPVIQHISYSGNVIESLEAVKTLKGNMLRSDQIEVSIGAWVPKRMMKLYVDCCKELSEPPNLKVLKGLYNLQVSEDEIIVSDCELQDISVAPLLSAMHAHKTISVLDLSHNLLGNGTMERLQQMFTSSGQSYGGLVLDLHCNLLGPTALFQICECPALYARLEVLNVSGNRLTDSCASYLSAILCNCKALYSLNIENCSIASRTIQKVADSLDSGSVLTHLSIGHNNPISGNAITILLNKLANLKRIQELNLNGIKLSKPVVDSLCQFSKNSCLSGLMLGSTNIGTEGALQLIKSLSNETQELLKLYLSSCGLTSDFIFGLSAQASLISSILELNLGGNPIKSEGTSALVSLLINPQSCLKILVLDKCQLGLLGVLQILQALVENCYLEELNLAENVHLDDNHTATSSATSAVKSSNSLEKYLNLWETSNKASASEINNFPQESEVNTDYNQLEVADSEDDQVHVEVAGSALDENSTYSSQKKPITECNLFHELSAAIRMAKQLQMLDLSNNRLPQEVVETLYTAWSSSRGASTRRNLQKNIVHFSVNGKKCCSAKPCCRRF